MTTPTAPVASIPGGNGRGPEPPVEYSAPYDEPPVGVPATRSSYVESLPGIYQESDFIGRFLLIFEHLLSPVERTAGSTWTYFDAGLTPDEFIPWLGSWIGIVMDARVPEENRREILRAAPELFRWRGTKRGLRHFLHLYTGIEPEIVEPTLGEIASNRNLAYRFTVRLKLPSGAQISRDYVEALVEAEKPAFAACSIEITNG